MSLQAWFAQNLPDASQELDRSLDQISSSTGIDLEGEVGEQVVDGGVMVGSIGDNRLGGWYGYRASKAALNQFMRTLAVECRRSHPQLCITAIHPGTTDTALSEPFQSNVKPGKLYTPSQSAARILQVVSDAQAEQSGHFVNWDGKPIPW